MRAALYYDSRDLRVEEIEAPTVEQNTVELEVSYAGICGTDLHEYDEGPMLVPDDEPHPITDQTAPVTLGHEVSGIVRTVGDGVIGIDPGDEVVVNPMLPCGECQYCDAGKHNVCEDLGFIGLSGGGGGFAERLVIPAENVVLIPEGVSLAAGALVEPLTVALHAVRHSPLSAGDTAAVFGSGPIGICVIQAAKAAGADQILVSEPTQQRRAVGREVGADVVIDPTEVDPVAVIDRQTGGGVDVAFEVAGVESSFTQALHTTKHDGHLTVVSLYEETVTFDPNDVVTVERSIGGTNVYTGGSRSEYEYGMVLSMLNRGVLDADPLITRRIPLEDIVTGFETLLEDGTEHVKILVEPRDDS